MQAAERALIEAGNPVEVLMDRAGRGAGDFVMRVAAGRMVTVLCGPGNNGGDGWVIARHLAEHDHPVRVIAAREPATEAAKAARAAFQGLVVPADPGLRGEVLVDCLFGSGLARPLPDDLHFLLTGLAERHARRIAIDLPSGIEADSGLALNPGLPEFDLTVALGAWKHAHFAMPAAAAMGQLRLVDIGVTAPPGAASVLDRPRLSPPAPDAHKYRRGLLAIIGGAMPGAALLAAAGAIHAGAGYVRLVADKDPGPHPADLVVMRGDIATALDDPRLAAWLVGPGLGRDEPARERLERVLESDQPGVLDADALMLFGPDLAGTGQVVLTPHEGELATLERAFGLGSTGPKRERALALAAVSGAVVVAKGPDSLIAAPDGTLVVAPRAPTWLAVAGSGDVLAGIIASRLASHGNALLAAREGLWLHGEAARQAGPAFSATDLAASVRGAVQSAL